MRNTIEPSILYKFRDDSPLTETIFRDRKVWLASPNKLNDPLECQSGHIPMDWQAETIRKMEDGQLMGMVGMPGRPLPKTLFSLNKRLTREWWVRFRTLSHQQKLNAMRKLYSDHGIQLSRPESIFEDMHQRLANVGVFSLSKLCDNELMWAHYGSSHSGLAIGFMRTKDCKLGNTRHTLPVAYVSEKPQFSVGFKSELTIYAMPGGGTRSENRVSFEDRVFRASLSTKTPAWGYEREWRYVEESNGLFDWPGALATITFGLRMPPDRRNFYRQLVQESACGDVEYFEVKLNPSKNGLQIEKLW